MRDIVINFYVVDSRCVDCIFTQDARVSQDQVECNCIPYAQLRRNKIVGVWARSYFLYSHSWCVRYTQS